MVVETAVVMSSLETMSGPAAAETEGKGTNSVKLPGTRSPSKSSKKGYLVPTKKKSTAKPGLPEVGTTARKDSGTKAISSGSDNEDEGALRQGPWLLKLAKSYHAAGENPAKAFQYVSRAIQCFEKTSNGKPCLELVVCLHILAALQCRLGQFEEAVAVLKRSLTIPDPDAGTDHVLATFAGHMQLGDTYALSGKHELSLFSYQAALQVQKQALGDMDLRVAETCRYVAEAYLQAVQFSEAEELCNLALQIHKSQNVSGSLEEAADRRLMAMVCSGKGDYEGALEHLVLSSTVLLENELEIDVAAVDTSIGDALFSLGRDAEAVLSYQKALTAFKALKGDGHASVAAAYLNLAEVYVKTGKLREAKSYCESALRIYGTRSAGHTLEDIVYGLADIAGVYEKLHELEQAISLLVKALEIQGNAPGQHFTSAGIEAQLGVMYYMAGKFSPAVLSFRDAVLKLKSASERKTLFLGMLLNQMGLACVELCEIQDAVAVFEEARSIMADACGPLHGDTLAVCSNLASTYDALGRTDEAIRLLENVLDIEEERLGTAHPEIRDSRERLSQLLKEAGRTRTRRSNTLEELLSMAKSESNRR